MWTLKNQNFRRLTLAEINQHNKENPRNPIAIGKVFDMQMTFTVTDGENDIEVTTSVDSEDTAVRTMRDKLEKMNKQEAFMARANDPKWTLPEKAAPREKTDLEKKQELYEAERAELVKLKEDVELGIADENDVTNKVNAVRNARTEFENARRNA